MRSDCCCWVRSFVVNHSGVVLLLGLRRGFCWQNLDTRGVQFVIAFWNYAEFKLRQGSGDAVVPTACWQNSDFRLGGVAFPCNFVLSRFCTFSAIIHFAEAKHHIAQRRSEMKELQILFYEVESNMARRGPTYRFQCFLLHLCSKTATGPTYRWLARLTGLGGSNKSPMGSN